MWQWCAGSRAALTHAGLHRTALTNLAAEQAVTPDKDLHKRVQEPPRDSSTHLGTLSLASDIDSCLMYKA